MPESWSREPRLREPRSARGSADDDPEPDRAARPPTVLRLGSAGRAPGIATALILAFVALAVVKPWAVAGPRPALVLVPPRPTPTPTADPLAALRDHCQDPAGWRIYARERWATLPLRSWRSLEPARAATGPSDPAIPIVPIGAEVDALGYCSPWEGSERPPVTATLGGWRVAADTQDGTPRVASEMPLVPLDFDWPGRLGALYAAPGTFAAPPARRPEWPAGRYIFALRAPGWERWWGVDVMAIAGPAASSEAPRSSVGAASPSAVSSSLTTP